MSAWVWVPRTLADLRAGDRCRMGGVEATVKGRAWSTWPLRPSDSSEFGWRTPVLDPHGELYVTLDFGGQERQYRFNDLSVGVEILLSADELAAVELLGWENRLSVYLDRQSAQA